MATVILKETGGDNFGCAHYKGPKPSVGDTVKLRRLCGVWSIGMCLSAIGALAEVSIPHAEKPMLIEVEAPNDQVLILGA